MLPDFPRLKGKLRKLVNTCMRNAVSQYDPVLSEVPKTRIFEGNRSILVRENGREERLATKQGRVSIEFKFSEVEAMTPDVIWGKIDKAARELARQQSEFWFETINKACTDVGNVRDMKGQKFSIEHLMQALEMVEIDFDERGKPCLPTIVGGKDPLEAIRAVMPQLETDPQWQKRFAQIIEKKKEQWRAREANRKLVG